MMNYLTPILTVCLCLWSLADPVALWAEVWPEEGRADDLYLNNGRLQIGIDRERGGAIFHLSDASRRKNLLNHADEGRFVQQSYYGNPDGSTWWNTPWCWNPIQGGGSNGRRARIISLKRSKKSVRVVTEPVQWATGVPATECEMEERIELQGMVAHVHYTFRNTGETAQDHAERAHEVPAVFADWSLNTFVTYSGSRPWQHDTLTRFVPRLLSNAAGGESAVLSESWAAYVDEKGYGIGVYSPIATECTLYRFGEGPGGPTSGSCSYFAPLVRLAITRGMVYSYDVYLTIGSLDEIRDRFYALHRKNEKRKKAKTP